MGDRAKALLAVFDRVFQDSWEAIPLAVRADAGRRLWHDLVASQKEAPMATVLARYPLTASGRTQASGHLDRLGLGVEYLHETDDALLALVPNFAGDEDAAQLHFDGATSVEHNALTGKAPKAGESEDWEPRIELPGGEVINRSAADREGPPPAPETQVAPPAAVQDTHAPDTATEPSPGLSGAGQSQARADKAQINAAKHDSKAKK